MTPEFWAIIAVGVSLLVFGLACLQLVFRRIDRLESRTDERFDRIEARQSVVEKELAHLRGVLDVLREALFERARS